MSAAPPGIVKASSTTTTQQLLLSLIASGTATNKAKIVRHTGLARSTVTEHLDRLRQAGIVVDANPALPVGRGRPPQSLQINGKAGVVLAADVGTHRTTLAVADVNRRILDKRTVLYKLSAGPNESLDFLSAQFEDMLDSVGVTGNSIRAVAMGLPSPVDVAEGRPIHPPLMPGWDRYPVADTLAERFRAQVLLDNDVNMMAIGEATTPNSARNPLLFLHISDGIGCGIITSNGELLRGADGAAGDVGHLRSHGHDDTICRCGNVGCIESVASSTAVMARLQTRISDTPLSTEDDLIDLIRAGNPIAVNEVRRAASEIGEIAVTLVHVFNPSSLILSGPMADASDDLLAGVRAVVYRRALPLATRTLHIATSTLRDQAGIHGAIRIAAENAFSAPVS